MLNADRNTADMGHGHRAALFRPDSPKARDAQSVRPGLEPDPAWGRVDLDLVFEPIVSAFGLPPGRSYVGIRGDPSLRETVPLRPRQPSRLDRHAQKVLDACAWLLRSTGCYAVYIGFNSDEVRTESVFNPFNYEIHDADSLLAEGYLERHFVQVPYRKKMGIIQEIRSTAQKGGLRRYLPRSWRRLLDAHRRTWTPVNPDLIPAIMQSFARLRDIEGFYLRHAALSLSQNIVRASFNCDGTYVIAPHYFPRFVEEIAP
ncbi:MAG: hypothetical protein M0T84_17425 [Betaproteobacteria bacterium]|nr:hypothetical protein [Betaproteobacteria bacterium]